MTLRVGGGGLYYLFRIQNSRVRNHGIPLLTHFYNKTVIWHYINLISRSLYLPTNHRQGRTLILAKKISTVGPTVFADSVSAARKKKKRKIKEINGS